MIKRLHFPVAIAIAFLLTKEAAAANRQPADWVDPMLGTSSSRWMLFPGPSMPFGMVKLSPDNEDFPKRWYKGGHEYSIDNIAGFSHVHSWTIGGLLTMPQTGPLKFKPGPMDDPDAGYRSRYRHETEEASPGYYAVTLDDYSVRAELTCTTRCGMQRYTFPKTDQARVLVDLHIPDEYYFDILEAEIRKVSETEVEGFSRQRSKYPSRTLQQDYTVHFVIQFNRPITAFGGWKGDTVLREGQQVAVDENIDIGAFLAFDASDGGPLVVRSAISYVSAEGARKNLVAELEPFGWDFDAVRVRARDTWNKLLGSIEVEGGTDENMTKFYTNLYRSYCARSVFSDVDGRYIDMYERIERMPDPGSPMLGCDAFWNTFWNLNQLWILATPELTEQWVRALLEVDRVGGWLPKGPAAVEYSSIMVASHEIPLIVAAYQAGMRGFDVDRAWRAVKHIQTTPGGEHEGGGEVGNENLDAYMKLGYVPLEEGPVSNTMEFAYDDWCTAQLAKALGHDEDYRRFMRRSANWRNVYDPLIGFVRQRHADGRWAETFDPFGREGFVEGNAWQFTFFVPHDVPALVATIGPVQFNRRLEAGLVRSLPNRFNATGDQYHKFPINHGNQPNMQSCYLFNYSGAPWLAQYWARQIMDVYYGLGPEDGYPGDEDQGQMGAWFVMSALGLFQMDGGCRVDPIYEIGSPLFRRAVIHLDPRYYAGKQFIIETRNNGPKNVYVQRALLDGKPLEGPWFRASDLFDGGTLVFDMGPEPNTSWECVDP